MIQFLNNIWNALNSQNPELVSLLTLPLFPIENFLLMSCFLNMLNINSSTKQKVLYVLGLTIISILIPYLVPSPFNILVNYISGIIFIKLIFKLSWLKKWTCFYNESTFIFVLLNTLISKSVFNHF